MNKQERKEKRGFKPLQKPYANDANQCCCSDLLVGAVALALEALANGLGTRLDEPVCNTSAAVCVLSPLRFLLWLCSELYQGTATTRKNLTGTRIEVIQTSLQ